MARALTDPAHVVTPTSATRISRGSRAERERCGARRALLGVRGGERARARSSSSSKPRPRRARRRARALAPEPRCSIPARVYREVELPLTCPRAPSPPTAGAGACSRRLRHANDHDEFGLIFVRGDGRRARGARDALLAAAARARASSRSLELTRRAPRARCFGQSQPSETSPEAGYRACRGRARRDRRRAFVDLHMHSTASDGARAARAVVAAAHARGLAAIALTDHDTVDGVAAARAAGERARRARDRRRRAERARGRRRDAPARPAPRATSTRSPTRSSRFRDDAPRRAPSRSSRSSTRSASPVTMDACSPQAGGGAVGRPHVARALIAGGWVGDQREAFDRYLGAGKPAYVAKPRLEVARRHRARPRRRRHRRLGASRAATARRERVERSSPRASTASRCATRATRPTTRAARRARRAFFGSCRAAAPTGTARATGRARIGMMQRARRVARAAGARRAAAARTAPPERWSSRGRVALVTGAGRRVGRAIAVALGAARHARRRALQRHAARGRRDRGGDRARGREARRVPGGPPDAGAPERSSTTSCAHFGALDVLVNSAAVMERTPIGEVTPTQWDAMFALNLRAPFFAAQAAAPHCAARRRDREHRRPRRVRDVARRTCRTGSRRPASCR